MAVSIQMELSTISFLFVAGVEAVADHITKQLTNEREEFCSLQGEFDFSEGSTLKPSRLTCIVLYEDV